MFLKSPFAYGRFQSTEPFSSFRRSRHQLTPASHTLEQGKSHANCPLIFAMTQDGLRMLRISWDSRLDGVKTEANPLLPCVRESRGSATGFCCDG